MRARHTRWHEGHAVLVQCRIPVGIISILSSENRRPFSMDGPDAVAAQRRRLHRWTVHLTGHVGHTC